MKNTAKRSSWKVVMAALLVTGMVLWFSPLQPAAIAQSSAQDVFATPDATTDTEVQRPARPDGTFRWTGAAAYDGAGLLTCGGVTGTVLFEDGDTTRATVIIGSAGEVTTIESLDLSQVEVFMIVDAQGSNIVVRVVQGPVMGINGRVSAVDDVNRTVTVNGVTIRVTDNTRLGLPRNWWEDQEPTLADLEVDTPVHSLAQFVNGEYFALTLLVPRNPNHGDKAPGPGNKGNNRGSQGRMPRPGMDG